MPGYMLDTNHIGLAIDGSSVVGKRVFEARLGGLRLGTCVPVLCEIEAGMRQADWRSDHAKAMQGL
jgi:predicted nucleic acid-binding protein